MVPLKNILKAHFGSDFAVGPGTSKKDDPLVITDKCDYVALEHEIASFLLKEMGYEFKLERQLLHHLDDRVVDELVFAAREAGDAEWSQTRRFFFDITAGYNSAYQRLSNGGILERVTRHSITLLVGAFSGVLIGLTWLIVCWLWGKWGSNLVTTLFFSDRNQPSQLVLDLVPVGIGALIFSFGIDLLNNSSLGSQKQSNKGMLIWSATTVCGIFAAALAAFMLFLSHYASGFQSVVLAGLGCAYLTIPTAAAIYAARRSTVMLSRDAA